MDESFSYYHFLIVAFVLLLNGFFASAEVALLSARPSKLKQMAERPMDSSLDVGKIERTLDIPMLNIDEALATFSTQAKEGIM